MIHQHNFIKGDNSMQCGNQYGVLLFVATGRKKLIEHPENIPAEINMLALTIF